MALSAETTGPLDRKPGRGQCTLHASGAAVGRKGPVGGGPFRQSCKKAVLPEFRVSRRRKSVQEPGIGKTAPGRKGPAGIADDHLRLKRFGPNDGVSLPKGLDHRLKVARKLRMGRKRPLHVLHRQRMGLEACIGQAAFGAACAPFRKGRQHVETGAESKFGDSESRPESPRKAVAGQKDVPELAQGVIRRKIDVAIAGRDRNGPFQPLNPVCIMKFGRHTMIREQFRNEGHA